MVTFSIDMVKLGGLQILMALYQYLKYDEEVAEEIGKLLSVASLNKNLIEDIFLTGMILQTYFCNLYLLLKIYLFILLKKTLKD
jgi:hypothetical protein